MKGEAVGEEGERVDAVGGFIALHAVPVAAIVVWFPGGENVRVLEVFLDLEKGFLVFWITAFGDGGREQRGKEEEEQ